MKLLELMQLLPSCVGSNTAVPEQGPEQMITKVTEAPMVYARIKRSAESSSKMSPTFCKGTAGQVQMM